MRTRASRLVAGQDKETYNRPTVIVTPSGEGKQYLKGTGRSIEGVNLYALLKHHEHLFEKFGGHAGACGFLMPAEHFDALREGLLNDLAARLQKIRSFSKSIMTQIWICRAVR